MNSDIFLDSVLSNSLGSDTKVLSSSFIGGGCINNTLKLSTTSGSYFLKWKQNEPELFEKEKEGLEILSNLSPIKIPKVIHCGLIEESNYLLLEFIEKSAPSQLFWEDFGNKLSHQHSITNPTFGLDHDNHIGRLPQRNESKEIWVDFFIQNRLMPQLEMASMNGKVNLEIRNDFDSLFLELPNLFPNERPALLHGDLWSGNFMVGPAGDAWVFDPAIYFGHREAEIAFTQLFGGFDSIFYAAYNEQSPLEPGFEQRIELYNIYPLLVHLNLFGEAYLSGITNTLSRYSN